MRFGFENLYTKKKTKKEKKKKKTKKKTWLVRTFGQNISFRRNRTWVASVEDYQDNHYTTADGSLLLEIQFTL